ncbi:zinc-alpha-2-glycoprotein-like [Danio aesculapii]|uniref:zinc-alpha-2-glycoprotein-like n=1 Tax=Danio aesculapii TaxID=1142201 RepID=UPI0024C0042F|nr:zinc-alpha-2-glycoprotein-like [Danio aesculapii]
MYGNVGKILHLLFFLLSNVASKGSHSMTLLATYIEGQTPFPKFSYVWMLDDIRVMYYDGDTKTRFPRGNTTAEDDVFSLDVFRYINDLINKAFVERLEIPTKNVNKTEGILVLQRLVVCELRDDGEPGKMITRDAFRGSTTDELQYVDNNFTYQGSLNVSEKLLQHHLADSKWNHESLYQPNCIKTLKRYLEKRRNQVNRKVKPRVRLIQKANPDSRGIFVTCLATGFYPRHINLTLLRDQQPVSDHEVTGGVLLPNEDGTYQMRKSLEIREEEREKHKYTCSATHLSLDNSMTVNLEFDHSQSIKLVISSVEIVLGLVFVFGVAGYILRTWKKKNRSAKSDDLNDKHPLSSKSSACLIGSASEESEVITQCY